MDVQSETNGVRNWYNLIADGFDKRYEGVEGLYWENFERTQKHVLLCGARSSQ